ncbi:AAA family ATPase [Metapseudomonas lalkuanensis]|uniref:AAA family ATPase n=1 Tax=Metapseudomonas lalkuanensis TaxID=2604832 RepID=UPI001CF27EC0|nr:ATP-binding protein [Pseudomonas lalkuanensis]UCO96401.1 AAA family ATPase [Pseudomonas lalkuanensis]
MLKSLLLEGVGPAKTFGPVEFSPRLNFITGDNGLGKSFLLDIAWWSLTRTWARGVPAVPPTSSKKSSITYAFSKSTSGDFAETSVFKRSDQQWPTKQGRPAIPGVVIYAGVDGSFSAWDPARNYWQGDDAAERPRAFNFTPEQVWNGLEGPNGIRYCNGLIHDWVLWQKGRDEAFSDLIKVLAALSPSGVEHLEPGQPVRLGLDVKDYPSLRMSYGQDVALVHASAGMRRIAALAYLLVWTWREHRLACEQTGRKQAKEIIFLIDEIECHLHPQWQRRVVPALLRVMQALTGKKVPVQLIVATHSPLVLASVEPEFDESTDAVFNIGLCDGQAEVSKEPWAKQGDVVNWLVSDSFGLRQARSVEAEQAIEAAEAWMRGDKAALPEKLRSQGSIHKELLRVLPGHDEFWPRWLVETQQLPRRSGDA